MGGLPRPEIPPGSQRDLVDALHDLHHRAGWPSLRVLAREAGCSHTTVSTVFSSPRLPSWGVLELLVQAMDGDVTEFRRLWLAASAPEAASAPAGLLIAGRRPELAAVRSHLDRGSGLLLVTGEAGMGKTRLVSTASTLAAGSTFVAAGSCLPLSSQVPLLPVADVLRTAYEVDDGQWLKDALSDCAPYVAGSLHRLLPEVDLAPDATPSSDDEWARQRLFGAIEATLAALASLRPMALLLEDLHWADSATLDLVEHLLARRVAVPVVGTWRLDDPATPDLALQWRSRVQRLPSCTTLELHLLSREETAEQVELLMTGPADPRLVERIHRRTAGQPLFTEQLVGLDEAQDLPRLLGDLLDQRLSGLGEPAWAVARTLGVADRSLPDALLADATELGSRELAAALHDLGARHLLRSAPGHHVELRHPLLAEAIRRRLVAIEVADEHRRIAAALSRSADPAPAEVAEHWRRAEDSGEELVWWIRAARVAGQRFALVQAAEQWRRALALWPESSAPVAGVDKHDAYLEAMDALLFTDLDAAWEVAQEAMHDLTDRDSLDAAATYRRAASIKHWLDDPAGAVELVEHAIRIHRAASMSVEYVLALHEHDSLLIALGRYDEAAASAARALDICAHLDAPEVHRSLLIQLSNHDIDRGDLDGALSHLDEAADLELTGPDPEGDVYLGIMRTETLRVAGRVGDEVAEAGRPGLESAASWGLETFPALILRGNVSASLRLSGQVARAAELIDAFIGQEQPTHEDVPVQAERASLDLLRGRCAEALARFDSLAALWTPGLSNRIEVAEDVASADLWCGRPRPALDRRVGVLRDSVDTAASTEAGAVLALAARAAADVADASGASDARRRELRDQLQHLLEQAQNDPVARAGCFEARPAHGAAWAAETARLVRQSTLELWAVATRHWDRLGRPHDAAYCRWRGALVALATGQGTVALRLLKRAARDAREHVPLSAAIAETAARAAARG